MFTDASPTYSIAEAARLIGAPASTLSSWTRQKSTRPLVRRFPGRRALSFRSLAEAFVVAAVRKEGVPMQRIRPALVELAKQIGMEQALASKRLYTDGAEILYDLPGRGYDGEAVNRLVVVRSGRCTFRETVQACPKADRVRRSGGIRFRNTAGQGGRSHKPRLRVRPSDLFLLRCPGGVGAAPTGRRRPDGGAGR